MNIKVFDTPEEGSRFAAGRIKKIIDEKTAENKRTVLGLATGGTPVLMYKELVRLYTAGQISFKNVLTFNLDEYHPMAHSDEHSYHYFMQQHLFGKVDISPEAVNIPSGEVDAAVAVTHGEEYENKIKAAGGIDLQILGIGSNGHIGFNEPGSGPDSETRYIDLDARTRSDAAAAFGGLENVPRNAISMGMKTILEAEKVILMAWGKGKAGIIRDCIAGEVTPVLPASYLQTHPAAQIILDKEAASLLRSRLH